MQVTTSKETLCINQVIAHKTVATIVEEDIVVPDIKPDILDTIKTSGTVCIYKKEIMDGKVKIDGSINTYIMYVADDENSGIRSLNTSLNFSQVIDIENVKIGMDLESNAILKTIECRILNGRKINLRAIMDINLKVLSNDEIEFVKQVEDIKDIQMKNMSLNLNSLLGKGMTKVYAKDTIIIDNMDNLSEILKVDLDIINQETKISYNKILVKADVCTKILYLTDDNRICKSNSVTPIMGFIDMKDVTDENLCDINFEIKNVLIKPNSIEEHSIYVEAEIEINVTISESKQIDIIQDLYSPSIDLNYKQKQIKAIAQKQILRDTCCIREKQFIEEIGNNKIYDIEAKPSIINKTLLNGRIVYEGEMELNFLFDKENTTRMMNKNIVVPFTFNMDFSEVNPTSEIETNIKVVKQDFTILEDTSIDINMDLDFIVNLSNNRNIEVIEDIEIDETRNQNRCSLVIYFVKQGDTLWNIAKKYKSTVDAIVQINDIEDENKISVGDQLFIPNFAG